MENQEKPNYKISFSSRITKISNYELDRYISLASLEQTKNLMPKEVNLQNNIDLIGCVANACNTGIINRNGDGITNKVGSLIAKNFVWKYVNAQHKRHTILGAICNYGFNDYKTGKALTEEEVLKQEDPTNISIAFVLYKTVLTDEFIELLEDAANENSPEYGKLSLSWELIFSDYDISVGSRLINESKIITDPEEKQKYEKYLQANGGSGKDSEGNLIGRIITNNVVVPAGVGVVENPAGYVRGIHLINEDQKETKAEQTDSQNSKSTVNIEEQLNNSKTMNKKISSIKDLTDDNLKESNASQMMDLLNSEIEKANEQWKAQVSAKESELKDINEKYAQAASKAEKAEKDLTELTKKFEDLNNKVLAQESEAKFNARMSYFDSEYELNDEYREIIASEIKDISDENFEKYQKRATVLFKHINKKVIAEAKAKAKEEAEKVENAKAEAAKLATASTNTTEAQTKIEDALKNGKQSTADIPNGTQIDNDLYSQFKAAFSVENCLVSTK